MGLLNPLNLIWALALVVLAIIYLRSRSRPTIEVSSLMLFDEVPAPVARVRHVRIDPLFWLELTALSALILAIAGFYAMVPARAGQGRSHALIFDLGAGMTARSDRSSSIDDAKKRALQLVNGATVGDEFSVITYALEAQVPLPQTHNLDAVRNAIDGLTALDVPAHPSALAAAIMRGRGSSQIELFTDRQPPADAIGDGGSGTPVKVSRIGHSDDNVAIVSIDPGVAGSSRGRAVLRNFSAKPRLCEFQIMLGSSEVFHETLMFAPREQMVVPFGPLKAEGLVAARILTPDAIQADNQHWAYATFDAVGRALVLSPEVSVREDLARILLAISPNLEIETADPAKYLEQRRAASGRETTFATVVMHDSYVSGIPTASTLLIFPPPAAPREAQIPGLINSGKNSPVRLSDGQGSVAQEATLPNVRDLSLPEWMETLASGIGPNNEPVPLAAIGRIPGGRIGILAFDVRDRLLLDPDRLDALLVTVNLIKRLTAPADVQIVPTGAYVSIPVAASAQILSPGGIQTKAEPDRWGRVRLRPMESGRYEVTAGGKTVQVFANYFDASESDLASAPAVAPSAAPAQHGSRPYSLPRQVQPLLIALAGLAIAAFIVESMILSRHSARWGMRHV